jgi:glucans biosynthesis protein C
MLTYPLFFLYGALLFSLPPITTILRRHTKPALAGALITTLFLFASIYADGIVAFGQYPYGGQRLLHALSGWLWVVALLGLAYRSLNVNNALLVYANEAVLPFYMLHQTVIILVGYAINQTDWPLPAKYGVVLVGAFLGILLLYAGMIQRMPFLRYLFGMKAKLIPKHGAIA